MNTPAHKDTRPSRLCLCILLSRNNHTAGALLYSILYWNQYGKAVIPNVEGYWVAHTRDWWCREVCLSLRQYDRAIAKLAKWGLVEKRQWWFGRRNILFVRPTASTKGFVTAAKTWAAAHEIVKSLIDHLGHTEISEFGNPSSPIEEISNVFAESGDLSLPPPEISNNIIHSHNSFGIKKNNIPTSPLPASPTCANKVPHKKKVSGEEKKSKKSNCAHSVKLEYSNAAYHVAPVFTLQQLLNIWKAAVDKYHAQAFAAGKFKLPSGPKDLGALAEINEALTSFSKKDIGDLSFQPFAGDIIAYAVEHWADLDPDDWGKKKPYPSAKFVADTIGHVVNHWHKAGRPLMPAAIKAACGPPAAVPFDVEPHSP